MNNILPVITGRMSNPSAEVRLTPICETKKSSNTVYHSLCEAIKNDFEKKHVYRTKGLTITKYAEMLGIHAYKISACINAGTGMSFTEFVNTYRLADAKRMLADKSINHYTAEAIGLDAGFSSKATFFPAFKKLENTTPGEYRKQVQS